MTKKFKRNIAREFLYFLSAIILWLIIVSAGILNTSLFNKNCNKLKSTIYKNETNMDMPYRIRIFYIINERFINNEDDKIKHPEEFISKLLDEKFANRWYDYVEEKTPNKSLIAQVTKEDFKNRIRNDTESEQYLENIQKLKTTRDNKLRRQYEFYNSWRPVNTKISASTIAFIFFFLRYIIYATIWSWKQIKMEQ